MEGKRHALQRITEEDFYLHFTLNPFTLHPQIVGSARKPTTNRKHTDIFNGVEKTKGKGKMAAIEKRMARLQFRFFNIKSNATIRAGSPIHRQPL